MNGNLIKIVDFVDKLFYQSDNDDFSTIFANSLYLFNDSINQDDSISILLLMTVAESILASTKQVKNLRVSTLIPLITKIPKNDRSAICYLFNKLYKKRNKFVHSAESIILPYDYETNKKTDLFVAMTIVAKLIIKYPQLKGIVDKIIDDKKELYGMETRLKYWSKYLDDLFNKKLFG